MTKFPGGSQVRSGHYVEGRSFEWAAIAKDGDALPGASTSRWVRIPTPVVVAVAPALGGLLVVGLPFISFGVVTYALARAIHRRAKANAEKAAALLVPGFSPGEAHLTGDRPQEDAKHEGAAPRPPVDERLDALEAELRALREKQKS